MPETISDTGPVLHLHEIGRLGTLSFVSPVVFPSRVWEELRHRGLENAPREECFEHFAPLQVERMQRLTEMFRSGLWK